jgi:hypothetical protein
MRCKADAVASPASVREEEEGAGWASSDKKAEWAGCFRGRKKKTWVGLLWILGRIPKKKKKKCFFEFLAAEMGEFKRKFEF